MSTHKLFTGTKLSRTFSQENSLAFQQAYEKTANSLQPPTSHSKMRRWLRQLRRIVVAYTAQVSRKQQRVCGSSEKCLISQM